MIEFSSNWHHCSTLSLYILLLLIIYALDENPMRKKVLIKQKEKKKENLCIHIFKFNIIFDI